MAGKLTCVNIETTQASSVAGPSIVGADSTWQTGSNLKYRKLPDGTVVCRGINDVDDINESLPAGYRPSETVYLIARNSSVGSPVTFYLSIQSSGAVGSSSLTGWAGVEFRFMAA